jgi:hypothetical protein
MTKVMQGIRVLEIAQHTFVPAAGAILADWGADVIKIEHPVRGDAMRGLITLGGQKVNPDRNTLMEHPNRGKRSVGVDISTAEGQQLVYDIAKTADVFLTNYLPQLRRRLNIDVEHRRTGVSGCAGKVQSRRSTEISLPRRARLLRTFPRIYLDDRRTLGTSTGNVTPTKQRCSPFA